MDSASPSAPSRASILQRWMLHHLLLRARRGSYAEATVQDRPGQRLLPWGCTGLHDLHFTSPDSLLERDTRPKDQGLKKDFGDTTVQDCSTPQQQRPPAHSKRCLVTDGTPIKCAWNGPLATVLQYGKGPSREEAAAGRVCLRGTKIFLEHFLSLIS